MTDLDVEFIESDVSGSDEDFLDERIETLEDCEIEEPRTVLIHIWWDQLPVLRHLFLNLGDEMVRSGLARIGRTLGILIYAKLRFGGWRRKRGRELLESSRDHFRLGKKRIWGCLVIV